jgi:hypothetical protein
VDFLQILAYLTLLLPFVVYLILIKKNNNKLSRVIFYYLAYSIGNEILMFFLNKFGIYNLHPNTRPVLYAIFTIIEFILLGYYLHESFKSKFFKRSLLFCGIIFLITAFTNLFFIVFSHFDSQLIDTVPVSTSALILLIFSILYFFEEIQAPEIGFIYSNPRFWIVVGIMIYFSGTFFFFLQYSNLSVKDQDNFWIINLICIILKNIFFSISFMLPHKNETLKEFGNSMPFEEYK